MAEAGAIRDRLSFPNLQRLEFSYSWNSSGLHRVELRVLRMLESIQTLRCLKISLALHHDDVFRQWIRTLQALPFLKKLELSCHQFVGGMAIQEFLQQCHRLEFLELGFVGNNSNVDQEDQDELQAAKAAIEKMPVIQLRRLSFSSTFDTYSETILHPLLERCPSLETLDLSRLNHIPTLKHLTSTLKDNRLPNFRHWLVGGLYGEDSQNAHAEMLGSFGCGLKSITTAGDPGSLTLEALTQYHVHSLTSLNLNDTPVKLLTFSNLMVVLANLRSVKAFISSESSEEDFDKAIDEEWMCIDLRSLELHLDTPTVTRKRARRFIDGHQWRGSRAQRCLDYVFSQVTKLRDLEKLQLSCSQDDLFLMKRGYLGQLAGLKRLRTLDLNKTPPSEFGELEALWMLRNWPKLAQVKDQGAPEVFRTTLLAKRPLIEVYS
ncbi:hypothetical protein BGX34_002574 [Mortierella sp. NVP85]|nr:hypothetical protein BGX34_002574 [Mortierella sp. NVP85]